MARLPSPPNLDNPPDGSSSPLLHPTDAADLCRAGLLVDAGNNRRCIRLHKRRLHSSSEEGHQGHPLNAPIPSVSSYDSDAFATIPERRISLETIVHVGLSEAKSQQLWQRWVDWPATGPQREIDPDDGGLQVYFIDFICGWSLGSQVDVMEDDDAPWHACLAACGVNDQLQAAIMDPLFKEVRLTNSCLFWIKDTIEMRYAGLGEVYKASRGRAFSNLSGNNQRLSGSFASSAALAEPHVSGSRQQQNVSRAPTAPQGATVLAARNAPGFTTLYKGIDRGRMAGLCTDADTLARIERLRSAPPSNFSGNHGMFYFTPDFRVAQYYACYAKRRAGCHSVAIVYIQIPNSAIEALTPPTIQRIDWNQPEWRELIWHCRKGRRLPSHLRQFRTALLIIGTVSKGPNYIYDQLASWEEVGQEHVLRIAGLDAV